MGQVWRSDLEDCHWIPFKWEKFGGDLDDDNWIPSKLETFWEGTVVILIGDLSSGDIYREDLVMLIGFLKIGTCLEGTLVM